MTHLEAEQNDLVRRLAARHRLPESLSLPTSPVAEELLHMIMKTSDPVEARAGAGRRRASWWSRRRLLVVVPGATALAALAILVSALLPPDGPEGPGGPDGLVRPAAAHALAIATEGDYVTVAITDPVADPERYRAELAAYGFDIELSLAPASPDRVGRVIFMELGDTGSGPSLEVIEAPGDCSATDSCSVEIRVPVGFQTYAHIVFGRTPLPDETFGGGGVEGDAPVLTPEEEQQLAALVGMRVDEARAVIAERGWTAEYRVGSESRDASADQVPGDWYVTDVTPLAGRVVVLWVEA